MTTQTTKKQDLSIKPIIDEQPITTTNELSTKGKIALLSIMLSRPEGATLKEMSEALCWLENSVRGAISTLTKKKIGIIKSEKLNGVRHYHLILNEEVKEEIKDLEDKPETI